MKKKHAYLRVVLVVAGSVSLFLGILGIILPLLPTTPFLLLAVACYARSSEKLYHWLLNHRLLGTHIRNYREGKGIPFRAKVTALSLLWLSIGYSALFLVPLLLVKLLLLFIALGVTIHILSIKTAKNDSLKKGNYL